ncbi:MAG: ATP-binding protein [Granulosicoccus sp.]
MSHDPVDTPVEPEDERGVQIANARILLVDDDDIYVHVCKRYLRSDKSTNHTAISAASIGQALVVATLDVFDCVIVDYCLPDGNGTDAINRLAEALGDKMPCTIILTGQASEMVAIEAVRSGASDFLTKPSLTKTALCRAVNNAIEKSRLRKLHLSRVKDLEIANGLLRKRNAEIQRFYHTVSHEVKTPLTAIQEFVSIVHDGLAGEVVEQQKTILNYALQSCDQIKSQFNDLLELSRFETGKMKVNLEPSSLYHVFDHCIVAAMPTAAAKQIELTIDDEPDLPMVMMQSNRIIQVLSNLIGNALKFTPEKGRVTVIASIIDDGARILLSVKDNGCGIPAEDIKHVFERLYQVTPASDIQDESGMGLGLSISEQIVRLHGSNIKVESTVGEGSEFSFTLNTCQVQGEQLSVSRMSQTQAVDRSDKADFRPAA